MGDRDSFRSAYVFIIVGLSLVMLFFSVTGMAGLCMEITQKYQPMMEVAARGRNGTCVITLPPVLEAKYFTLTYRALNGGCQGRQSIPYDRSHLDPQDLPVGTLLECFSLDFPSCQIQDLAMQADPKIYVHLETKIPSSIIGWLSVVSFLVLLWLCTCCCFGLSLCKQRGNRISYSTIN